MAAGESPCLYDAFLSRVASPLGSRSMSFMIVVLYPVKPQVL
jgi:hypothetical protein